MTSVLAPDDQFANAAAWFARSVAATRTAATELADPPAPIDDATPEATLDTARLVDAVRAAAGLPAPHTTAGPHRPRTAELAATRPR